MKHLVTLLFTVLFTCQIASAQDVISGTVMNAANDVALENVHVVNLNQVKGNISDENGSFEIAATVNDTLYFTYIGFKSIKVRVTNDWLKYGNVKVKMTEVGIALEEVTVSDVKLTGYLEIDAKNIPIYENKRYSISGLNSGYEAGDSSPSAFNKVIGSIFNPADALNNLFSRKERQMRKLRKMKDDESIRELLGSKYNRETLTAMLQMSRGEIEEVLSRCSYSEDFVRTATDLQILDAISGCWEEYKLLQRNKN
ncbi:carboxypeptidase-like regulatory domain-containing protein [Zunongwangia endophytica]|uniref:Carboxypeptidase-like regulatory domain-containing protein n=1 Tax=Zunongwangia endophytica TaxID=1808945 RepID=A0ABV8HAJ9_9FLAO|nr:carboxypeptidase-like regulatory domain-containing protein [Zunongwangia endophytica]MDN3593921.1 carboxypeptidase-like regulatory domain-containing protein [Zunongwangia endophytica]